MRDRAAGKKRKRSVGTPTASPLDVVVACLRGDQAALEAALGVERRGGALLPGCRFPQLAESSVAGCRPLDAAVIGNSPGCIRLLATIVDVDAPLEDELDSAALLAALPADVAAVLPRRMRTTFPPDSIALHCALRLNHLEASEALLDAGADPNSLEGPEGPAGQTPLGWLCMFARGFQLRNRPRPSTEALLHKLLAKGACPFLPPDNPAISLCGFAMAGPLADFMVRAHVAGQHLLSQEHVVGLLQLVLLHNHRPAYPQLLAILRQEGAEPLPPSLALQLLAIAARWGDEAAVRDALALVPQGVLTAPESAPACLLAHAALNDEPARPWPASGQPSRGQQSARIMRVLLDAKVALHINDVCRVVQEARPGVLRRLLRIGQPQPDRSRPSVELQDSMIRPTLQPEVLACPVLLNLSLAVNTQLDLQTEHPYPSLPGALFEEFKLRMDVAEALGAAGYRPIEEFSGQDEDGPWIYKPFKDEPDRYGVDGPNRLLMLALEQPALGPDTFARFPRSLRAAVREVLLIAAHGKGIQVGELQTEQLASLIAWRRQQLYARCEAMSQQPRGLLKHPERDDSFQVLFWAQQRDWAPKRIRQAEEAVEPGPSSLAARLRAALRAADGMAAAGGSGAGQLVAGGAAAGGSGAGQLVAGGAAAGGLAAGGGAAGALAPETLQMLSAAEIELLESDPLNPAAVPERVAERRGKRQRAGTLRLTPGDSIGPATDEVLHLERLEQQLEERLFEGGMPRPELPSEPHPLRRLPPELVLHILQLAAYPLSAWVELADFQQAAAAAPGQGPSGALALPAPGGEADEEADLQPGGGSGEGSSSSEEESSSSEEHGSSSEESSSGEDNGSIEGGSSEESSGGEGDSSGEPSSTSEDSSSGESSKRESSSSEDDTNGDGSSSSDDNSSSSEESSSGEDDSSSEDEQNDGTARVLQF